MKIIKPKICKQCGSEFQPSNSLNNTCSMKCYYKYIDAKEKAKKAQKREAKKISVSVLSKKLDKLWSEHIRSVGKCEYCGKKEFLNSHHIFGRNNKSTRWETQNGICLCSGCHTFSSIFSAHKTPTEFTYWLENYKGKDFINILQKLAHEPHKVTSERLQERIKYFELLKENIK